MVAKRGIKKGIIKEELREHLPLTFIASLVAGALVLLAYSINREASIGYVIGLFEITHPLHVLVSASATSAIYYKYKKSLLNAIVIGILGAIAIGTLSDILLPWITGNIFFLDTSFHLSLIETPWIILGTALVGSLVGIYFGFFRTSHGLHVFLSIFASLFYLLAFSPSINFLVVIFVALIVFISVFIPCCISDIVFPLWFIKKPCKSHGRWHEHN